MKQYIILFFIVLCVQVKAQQVANCTLPDVMKGSNVSLSDYASQAGLVVIFTSNACPYDEYYHARIKKLVQDYSGKISFVLVNAYPSAPESVEEMKKKGNSLGWSIPYLADKEQALMQSLNATKSPEAFLLKYTGGKFSVVYRGAIDDNAQVEADVHHSYLKNALDAHLAGRTIEPQEMRAVGCTIRKK